MQTRTTRARLPGNVGGIKLIQDRYYVQGLTDQIFLVRERVSAGGESGPDDRIVRSFDIRHDANMYAESMNEQQRKLDAQQKAN